MPESEITKADAVARSLLRLYQRNGEFAITIRTHGEGFRLIGPRTDMPRLSEWLRLIADRLFDGPNEVTVPNDQSTH